MSSYVVDKNIIIGHLKYIKDTQVSLDLKNYMYKIKDCFIEINQKLTRFR